jgi:hypothetical protein
VALRVDLVVIDSEPASYQMPLQRELVALREQFMRDVRGTLRSASAGRGEHHRCGRGVGRAVAVIVCGRPTSFGSRARSAQWHADALARRLTAVASPALSNRVATVSRRAVIRRRRRSTSR